MSKGKLEIMSDFLITSSSSTQLENRTHEESDRKYAYHDYAFYQDDLGVCDAKPQGSKNLFPYKLNEILSKKEFSHIISWLDHGRSFKIWDSALLERNVLPLFFESANYNSFVRLLNAWQFRRIISRSSRSEDANKCDLNSYYHELFLRNRPNLLKYMQRLPRYNGRKLPLDDKGEPNFSEFPPLPSESEENEPINRNNPTSLRKRKSTEEYNQQGSELSHCMPYEHPAHTRRSLLEEGKPVYCEFDAVFEANKRSRRRWDTYGMGLGLQDNSLSALNAEIRAGRVTAERDNQYSNPSYVFGRVLSKDGTGIVEPQRRLDATHFGHSALARASIQQTVRTHQRNQIMQMQMQQAPLRIIQPFYFVVPVKSVAAIHFPIVSRRVSDVGLSSLPRPDM